MVGSPDRVVGFGECLGAGGGGGCYGLGKTRDGVVVDG